MKYADIRLGQDPLDETRLFEDRLFTMLRKYSAQPMCGPFDAFGNRLPIPGGGYLVWDGRHLACFGPDSIEAFHAHARQDLIDALIAFPSTAPEPEPLPDPAGLTSGPTWVLVPVLEAP